MLRQNVMDQESIDNEVTIRRTPPVAVEVLPVTEVRKHLSSLLRERVVAGLLDEQDERILSLRLGLEDGKCSTLKETAARVNKSPEVIRRRQYLALKKGVKDLRFFKLLRDYTHLVKLPLGVTYYINKRSEYILSE
ncbi:MAG TPA: hypothetical protein VKR06_00990 [Ktedonosporobacter sp.]|nr:hypothetical protein [Ktedonosporobacter sp.]